MHLCVLEELALGDLLTELLLGGEPVVFTVLRKEEGGGVRGARIGCSACVDMLFYPFRGN